MYNVKNLKKKADNFKSTSIKLNIIKLIKFDSFENQNCKKQHK